MADAPRTGTAATTATCGLRQNRSSWATVPREPALCPICGHLTATGAHEFQTVPGYSLPFIACPSFAEVVLDAEVIVFDQDETQAPLE